ncbi:MAG: hypothetical protein ACPGUC_08290 [Gammaproteobacteria bacterium]
MRSLPQRLFLTLMLGAVLALSLGQTLDRHAATPVDESFKRALVTFAVVRGINAVISVVQGTELAIEPAGVGVILTPGEVFDPVNDLIERFSWIMLLASTSLGAQKVLLDLGLSSAVQSATVLALALLSIQLWRPDWLSHRHSPVPAPILLRLAWLVLFIRFAVPLIALANEAVYQGFLAERYEHSQAVLAQTRSAVEDLQQAESAPVSATDDSLIGRIGRWYDQTGKTFNVEKRIEAYKKRLGEASEHIIHLIVVFLLQTVVFPLLFLWLGLRILRTIVGGLSPGQTTTANHNNNSD